MQQSGKDANYNLRLVRHYSYSLSLSVFRSILQHFNSRTCQLVLGAGAVEAVGLKTITARHLGEKPLSPLSLCLCTNLIIANFFCLHVHFGHHVMIFSIS